VYNTSQRRCALKSLCIQTVQLHSTTLTLTLDILKLKDAVAATVPWKTFTSILDFVLNFVAMAAGVSRGKCSWEHSMVHPQKPLYRWKNLANISYASWVIANFVQNFVAMTTGVGRGKMQLAAFDGPFPKTPLQALKSRQNLLRKPRYSQFCPKFRCHGNGVNRG